MLRIILAALLALLGAANSRAAAAGASFACAAISQGQPAAKKFTPMPAGKLVAAFQLRGEPDSAVNMRLKFQAEPKPREARLHIESSAGDAAAGGWKLKLAGGQQLYIELEKQSHNLYITQIFAAPPFAIKYSCTGADFAD